MAEYVVRYTPSAPSLPAAWDSPFWTHANTLDIADFHPASESTYPRTRARVLYDASHLYLHYVVEDQFVRARYTAYQSPVCQDSCAEFFVAPREGKGYFNFELNPLGTMLLFYVEDPTRVGLGALKKFEKVPEELARSVAVHGSEREVIAEPLPGERTWSVQYSVPFSLFSPFVGDVTPRPGTTWRANFYKCGDETGKPHWAAWSPIGEQLNFHQPHRFGTLRFE